MGLAWAVPFLAQTLAGQCFLVDLVVCCNTEKLDDDWSWSETHFCQAALCMVVDHEPQKYLTCSEPT